MSAARIAGAVLALAASAAIWFAWTELGLLRGTFWWEVRNVSLLVVAVMLLTIAQWVADAVDRATASGKGADPSH